jgi:hypothetical protein
MQTLLLLLLPLRKQTLCIGVLAVVRVGPERRMESRDLSHAAQTHAGISIPSTCCEEGRCCVFYGQVTCDVLCVMCNV